MKRFPFIFFLFIPFFIFSQNNFPMGKLRLPSENEIKQTKQLKPQKLKNNLPAIWDNTQLPYFRGIFMQVGGSCAQASGIGYTFTYEINRLRNTDASLPQNQYPSHFTYNFLNEGSFANGSFYTDGWEIIKAEGCPNVEIYGGMSADPYYWPESYQIYENGFSNRTLEYYTIDVGSPDGLLTLKNWLSNHCNGSPTGGLANFSAGASGYTVVDDSIIVSWGKIVNHAMTIVGWNDSIKVDINNDGQFTNDKDINNDGVIDMKDWEIGALIIANSWGTNWLNNGKAYMMYRVLAESVENGGIFANKVWVLNVRKNYEPKLILRAEIYHDCKKDLIITAGISTNLYATVPDYKLLLPVFRKQGGNFPFADTNGNPLKISLDITPLLSYVSPGEKAKIFLIISEDDPDDTANGIVYNAQVLDNNGNIWHSTVQNKEIENNTETYIPIDIKTENFDKPKIITEELPNAENNLAYNASISYDGGQRPYKFNLIYDYYYENTENFDFPFGEIKIKPNNNDDGYATIPLKFKFPFGGQYYDTMYVSTDGWIRFAKGFDYIRDDGKIASVNVIAVFASDLQIFTTLNQGIFYSQTDSTITFEWKTGMFGDSTVFAHFAATFFKDGSMQFFYDTLPDVSWATGISTGDGKNYLIPYFSGRQIKNFAYKIYPGIFPAGLSIDTNGVISGIIKSERNFWRIGVAVTDFNNISDIKYFDVGKNITNEGISAYPNPASDFTALNFAPVSGRTIIKIFNTEGKEIFSTEKNYISENRTFIWDLKNNAGIRVKQGVYVVFIINDKKIFKTKLIVLKK